MKTSEPDLRTPEQIEADREASRAGLNPRGDQPKVAASSRPLRHNPAIATGSAAKTAV